MICCSMVLRCVIFLSPFYFFIFLFGFPLLERKKHWFLWSPLKIFHHLFFEICSWRFVFWRFFQEIFHFHKDVFMEICHLKICSGDFSFFIKICSWWFVLWRFVQVIFLIEDLFKRFFLFHEDLFMEICSLKIEV